MKICVVWIHNSMLYLLCHHQCKVPWPMRGHFMKVSPLFEELRVLLARVQILERKGKIIFYPIEGKHWYHHDAKQFLELQILRFTFPHYN